MCYPNHKDDAIYAFRLYGLINAVLNGRTENVMKVTQYITNSGQDFNEYSLKPALKAGGISTVTVAVKPVKGDNLGFGVAITGASCYNLSKMEAAERTQFLKSIYGKDGLNLSVARLTVGSSDYSAEVYTYDDVENDTELKYFSIDRDKEYIIPMIKEILSISPELYIFASPWSPPGWMKTGGSMYGGYMREQYIDCYADYIVKYIKAYEAEGIKIKALTPQNEADTDQVGKSTACIWHPELEAAFIKLLRKKFDENGIDTEIWMYDHNFSAAEMRVDWSLENIDGLKNTVDGIAFHYYDGSIEQTTFLREKYPDIKLHFTEGGPRLYDNYATDWCKWSIMMTKVLRLGYSSFTGWNLMLDETGGPNIGPFFCGGLVTRDRNENTLKYSGQYKALKHFAKFHENGSDIYPVSFSHNNGTMFGYPNMGQPLEGVMRQLKNGNKVLTVINPNKSKRQVQINLGNTWWYIELLPETVSTVVFEE